MKISQKHLKFCGALIGLIAVVSLLIAVCIDQIRYQSLENPHLDVTIDAVFGFKSAKGSSDIVISPDGKTEIMFVYKEHENNPNEQIKAQAKELRNRGMLWMTFCILSGITAVAAIIGSLFIQQREKVISGLFILSCVFLIVACFAMSTLSAEFDDVHTMKWGPSLVIAVIDVSILQISAVMIFLSGDER